KFLFASTSEVYGNPLEHPQKESYWGNVNPVGPRGCYDEAKRFGEALCVAFSNVYGVDAKIARIFNTYGPRMRENDGRVIPNFIEQALGNRPLTVYGDGGQTRSFCYVSDMVSGLHSLMNSPEKGPINLGAPVETSILGLAEKIIRLSKSGSKIVYRKLPIDDPERRLPDISLAKSRLSWNPKVPLDEGLKLAISYFQKI
ncbi:MAG TPA: NAD-dependent epimerase/dehydratase family protein, partial [archaeon]|nr:NAD-dependent epimerase/dehydratase family protein [archaeon]